MYHETISCDYEGCTEIVQVPADGDTVTLFRTGWKFCAKHLCPTHAAELSPGMGVPINLQAAREYELVRKRAQIPEPKILREDLPLGAGGLLQ